jgi:polyferredoxin
MKRQKIRKAILFISFLLFPVTIYYFSPYLIIMAGLEGIISGSFIVFCCMFIASLFFGRAFCGWICPAGGIMESCAAVNDKRAKGGRRNYIKYFIWVPWIITIALIFISESGTKQLDFTYQTKYGISISEPDAYFIYYIVVALFVILSFAAGRRAGCHYICWMSPFMIIGTKIKNKLKYPSLHLESDKSNCTNCKLCTKKCPMSLDVNVMVQKGSMENAECILCGECVDTCPKGALRYELKFIDKNNVNQRFNANNVKVD